MEIQTVKDMREAISELPDEMPVMGYDGREGELPVTLIVLDYEDVEDVESEPRPPVTLMVSVD